MIKRLRKRFQFQMVRLKENSGSTGEDNTLFQFQMVRLKETFTASNKRFPIISIPDGTIKSS